MTCTAELVGYLAVTAPKYDLNRIVDRLGVDFDLRVNTCKPCPSGIVIHPTIDACTQLCEQYSLVPEQIESVELRVAPLVKDLCNKKVISAGLELIDRCIPA
jgi:2-methylcitrate dehydratase PrpD